jgi:hypothetical protein
MRRILAARVPPKIPTMTSASIILYDGRDARSGSSSNRQARRPYRAGGRNMIEISEEVQR